MKQRLNSSQIIEFHKKQIQIFEAIQYFEKLIKSKLHTIRGSYELWKKRIDNVNSGSAILSLRYWSGKPYNSKQVEVCQLDKDSGIGIQKLVFFIPDISKPLIEINETYHLSIAPNLLCKNDGLSIEDFKEWFRPYKLDKPLAIIHFTNFKY
jgi:hypothetical protein